MLCFMLIDCDCDVFLFNFSPRYIILLNGVASQVLGRNFYHWENLEQIDFEQNCKLVSNMDYLSLTLFLLVEQIK